MKTFLALFTVLFMTQASAQMFGEGTSSGGGAEGMTDYAIITSMMLDDGFTLKYDSKADQLKMEATDIECTKPSNSPVFKVCIATDAHTGKRLKFWPHPTALLMEERFPRQVKITESSSQKTVKLARIICRINDMKDLGGEDSNASCKAYSK